MRRFLLLALIASLFFGPRPLVRAQGASTVDLYPPDISRFPNVSALVDVFNEQGIFATGLAPEAFTVVEDGETVAPAGVVEKVLPAQLVVGINPGPALDVRNSQGISRFQRLTQVLDAWAQGLSTEEPDDLSLVSISGPVVSHANPNEFRNSLQAFQPDFRNSTPNLQSLALALDIAAMQSSQTGVKRAILFITPHMDDPAIATAMQPLIDRAVQNKIRVFVWFVDLDLYFVTTSAAAFSTLAVSTGGSMFAYSGNEAFPDPEGYFAPLRRTYTVSYTSAIKTGGSHTLGVQVSMPAGKLSSAQVPFSLDIQPPNPIPVSPPLQITRQAPEDDPYNSRKLLPEAQTIKIIIEFPDSLPRALVRTTFYVDGQIAAENTKEPFDTFTWDLTGYKVSGQHQIMVEAVDTMGLGKTSMPIPVTVTVVQPPRGLSALFGRYRLPVIIGGVSLAGVALLLILLTGRLRLPSPKARKKEKQTHMDPLTQPVNAATEPPTSPGERVKRKKEAAASLRTRVADAPASLVRLLPDGQPATENPIPLGEKDMALGTDPVACNYVLDDPSIGAVHARLKQVRAGEFMLYDNSSVAGTWVNYEPVGREGRLLQPGDVIHFGRLTYRFQPRTPVSAPQPKVVQEKPRG